MRTLTTIAVITVILLSGAWASNRYIHSSAQNLSSGLASVEQSIIQERWDNARSQLAAVHNRWDQAKTWWTILLNHQEIDNIDISMKRLERYIQTKGSSLSLGELSALQLLVDHISDNEKFNLTNIF